MFRSPFLKTLYDKRWVILAWSLGAFIMNLVIVWIFPDFKDPRLNDAFKNLPETLQAFAGSLDINTIEKYVDSQVFFNNGSIIFWILGISIGVNLFATEEDRGTLETTLATKIPRGRLYFEKFLAMIAIFSVVNLAGIAAIWLASVIIHEPISVLRLFQAGAVLLLFTTLLGSFSFGVGAMTGRKNLAIGLPVIILVAMFLLYTFAQSIDWLKGWDKATWNYFYSHGRTFINGIDYSDISVLIVSTAVFALAGWLVFRKRDLR
jgi:ABC-type transport system involved in multi-copper enzyme maturation permease subunit